MPTTIDSMTGVEIKSPFFDTAVSLELFPVHPNVLKIRMHRRKIGWHLYMDQMEVVKAQ